MLPYKCTGDSEETLHSEQENSPTERVSHSEWSNRIPTTLTSLKHDLDRVREAMVDIEDRVQETIQLVYTLVGTPAIQQRRHLTKKWRQRID